LQATGFALGIAHTLRYKPDYDIASLVKTWMGFHQASSMARLESTDFQRGTRCELVFDTSESRLVNVMPHHRKVPYNLDLSFNQMDDIERIDRALAGHLVKGFNGTRVGLRAVDILRGLVAHYRSVRSPKLFEYVNFWRYNF
jgi:hypothetical protein